MPQRRLFLLTAAAIVLGSALPALADDQKLFFIQRSKNANEVHYDARVAGRDGSLDPKNPVVGYWLNKAEDGSRSNITLQQRVAYGHETAPAGNGTYTLKMLAVPARPMSLVKVQGRWRALVTIAGRQAYLTRAYVATDEAGVIPKVLYLDLFGEEVSSGAPVQEHLVNQ